MFNINAKIELKNITHNLIYGSKNGTMTDTTNQDQTSRSQAFGAGDEQYLEYYQNMTPLTASLTPRYLSSNRLSNFHQVMLKRIYKTLQLVSTAFRSTDISSR